MPKYNIPKLARNKYNYVKNADVSNYVTQTQLMMASGSNGLDSNSLQSNQQLASAIRSVIDAMVASYDLVGGAYVIAATEEVQRNCYAYTDSKTTTSLSGQ